MLKKIGLWMHFAIGAVLGYAVVHPLIMVTADLMLSMSSKADYWTVANLISVLPKAFYFNMLPWALGISMLCAMVGWMLAKFRQATFKEHKLQGAMELAGAACHELNQPMQIVLGYSELLKKDILSDDGMNNMLQEVIDHIHKMDLILRKIRSITKYEAMEYVNGITIIDIDKASQH